MTQDDFYNQIVSISKAGAYDAIAPDYAKVKEENTRLKARVKFLEELINEYTLKMKANLSGGKVDSFLKEQVEEFDLPAVDQEIEQEMKDHDERNDIKNVL